MTNLAERDLTTESKGERTRRRILEIAIERFGERGYRATSVSEIARAAGLTRAASYAYFDSKESLFQAAVDADAEGLISDVAAQAQGVPIDALIPSVIVYAVMGLADHPLARRVLAGQEPDEIPRLVELPSVRRMLEELRTIVDLARPTDAIFRTNHASNYLPLGGRLPKDRERILEVVDSALRGDIPLRPEWARGL